MASNPVQAQTTQAQNESDTQSPSGSMSVEMLRNNYSNISSTASQWMPRHPRPSIRQPNNEWFNIIQGLTPLADNSLHGKVRTSVDQRVDQFLRSTTFELICVQAVQLAAVLPKSPPPKTFFSFTTTSMHQWYAAILIEFVEVFTLRLRAREEFPVMYKIDPHDMVERVAYENMKEFNKEATAHINAILASFNTNFEQRPLGSTMGLTVDKSRTRANTAARSLQEVLQMAEYPPEMYWKIGEPLHVEYKRRLHMFEACARRLIEEQGQAQWILRVPGKVDKGINAFKEYYIKHLRDTILGASGSATFFSCSNP